MYVFKLLSRKYLVAKIGIKPISFLVAHLVAKLIAMLVAQCERTIISILVDTTRKEHHQTHQPTINSYHIMKSQHNGHNTHRTHYLKHYGTNRDLQNLKKPQKICQNYSWGQRSGG